MRNDIINVLFYSIGLTILYLIYLSKMYTSPFFNVYVLLMGGGLILLYRRARHQPQMPRKTAIHSTLPKNHSIIIWILRIVIIIMFLSLLRIIYF